MESLPYIHIVKREDSGKSKELQGFFAVELIACPTVRTMQENETSGRGFYLPEIHLREQVDFINALYCPEPRRSFAIRYYVLPNQLNFASGKIDMAFLGKIVGSSSREASDVATNLCREVLTLLGGMMPDYTWKVVTESERFMHFWEAFPLNTSHLAAIRRREDQVRLETMRPRPMLGRGKAQPTTELKPGESVYFVHQFKPQSTTMSRLLRMMLMQKYPLMFQVTLSPVWLDEGEEKALTNEIAKSEQREQQASQKMKSLIGSVSTVHQLRARAIAEALLDQLLCLQDAPFLLQTVLASPEPIPYSLLEAAGVEITEPIGSSENANSRVSLVNLQMGGYDVEHPFNQQEYKIARDNFRSLEFGLWGHMIAPSGLERVRFLVDAWEAAAAFRFPIAGIEGLPGLEVHAHRTRTLPKEIAKLAEQGNSDDLLLLGENTYLGFTHPIYLKERDRRQHVYVVGQTGTGKTTLLKTMILSDMAKGEGMAVIDPHGDLFDEIMEYIPEHRLEDVVILDPTDQNNPVGLNMLEATTTDQKYFAAREMRAIMSKLIEDQFGVSAGEFAGPIFQRHTQMNMLLAMSNPDDPGTLLEFYEIFQHSDYWKKWMPLRWNDIKLKQWITTVLSQINYASQPLRGETSVGDWISSKFEDFVFDPKLRLIFGQKKSTINLRNIMDEGKILLVNLAKGELSEENARFLGMILMAKIQTAAMERTQIRPEQRKMFYLYVDEFQSIATQNFILMLSEARKFGLGLILANQFISQIKDQRIMQSIFGNVGTLISFRVGKQDAQDYLQHQFSPYFDKFDITNLPNWYACIKTTVNGQVIAPFTLRTVVPVSKKDASMAQRAKTLSSQKYGRPRREVEAEIEKSLQWRPEKQDVPEKQAEI